ncbi:MAG: AAA family ATPase, partial [Nitrospinae bacterium]|nr:AAA family ATPase [Nitrospinota bacterium]
MAACLTHGIAAVGRPNHSGGVDHLATLIQNRLADRAVIVMGDNDAKAKDGSWPGRDGARKVAAELTQRLGREIKWAMPPRQVKDIRELLTQMGSELTTESARLTVGPKLVGQLASDSFRPPIESRDGRNELGDPILASDLDDVEDVEYVVEGLIARGHITVLVSHPKDGKTTFAAHVVKAMGDGAQLAGSVAKGRVLIVTEESKTLWKRRRDELRLGEWVEFYIRPILGNPTQAQWEQLIEKIARLVQERDYTLVIFDTFANLSPVIDE